MTNRASRLAQTGQAIWLDFVSRDFLAQGGLEKLVDEDGVTGVTSNPAIFEKAMGQGTAYDDSLAGFLQTGDADGDDIYEHLAIQDIQRAADILRPVYDRLDGQDGYVSLEVSPYLANDTHKTVIEARRLWAAVDRPNLMVKVPGTEAGIPAIRQLIEEGINVNVTLLFSIASYEQVALAYVEGLLARHAVGLPVDRVASVASFFISRIDAVMDARIEARLKTATPEAMASLTALRGTVAIANAKMAYQHYLSVVGSADWKMLARHGARPQRLLWASTGTKNPDYPDTLYVDSLIGRDTVNTMPPKTLDAFRDHGSIASTLESGVEQAAHVLDEVERLGLDLGGAATTLSQEGILMFWDASDSLLTAVGKKRIALLGERLNGEAFDLPADLDGAVQERLAAAARAGWARRIWERDATLWTGKDEAQWQGWLAAAKGQQVDAEAIARLYGEVRAEGYRHAVLLGMGGSSLGPEVLAKTLGCVSGVTLHVLDSTDPAQVEAVERAVDMAHTLFIVSSKSGSTLEPEVLAAYFFEASGRLGKNFVAVTDPGSKLEKQAKEQGFRAIFHGDTTIGGRYSVLSVFGMVPLGIEGHDVAQFYADTQPMVRAAGPGSPPAINPGVRLGVVMGEAFKLGRDKLTIFASPQVSSMGAWLEQLVAESTGKQGKGIVPVDAEPIGHPGIYGKDRLFAYLRVEGDDTADLDAKVDALIAAGHPVMRFTLARPCLIGQEFFRWEVATAIAGAVIGIDPFDQPDVEASKVKTRALTDEFDRTGQLAPETPQARDGQLSMFGDASLAMSDDLQAVMKAHLSRLHDQDYAAVLAYIERNPAHEKVIEHMRLAIRDATRNATVGGFGPRFLHSTGQAYKGGPNTGVFLQITADPCHDLRIPGRDITFGAVIAAQARGDLGVLHERGRRYLRIHIGGGDVDAGLARISDAVRAAFV